MRGDTTLRPLIIFITILLAFIVLGRLGSQYILENYTDNYTVHTVFDIVSNMVLAIISYVFIKRYDLLGLAGLNKSKKLIGVGLLLFPLYLVVINLLFSDGITSENVVYNGFLLVVLCLSIGYAEELSLRGFLQSYLIKYYATNKKQVIWAVIGAAFIFGLLHLVKFDKGLYGELSQVFFATFIGVMFGSVLLRTKRIWPLIIIHALVDFAAKLDEMGHPFQMKLSNATDSTSAIVITLIVLPCFMYGLFILRKRTYVELVEY